MRPTTPTPPTRYTPPGVREEYQAAADALRIANAAVNAAPSCPKAGRALMRAEARYERAADAYGG